MIDLERFKRWMFLRELFLKCVVPVRFPLILNIEPTNRCNLSCSMCPRSKSSRPLVDMDFNLFLELVEELKREGPILRIFLQKDGEPLLYKELSKMIECLRKAKASRTISIITNGTLLTKGKFEELALAGLTDLIVSIDAVEAESYRRLKGLDRFSEVRNNVLEAISLKRKMGWENPRIKARLVSRIGRESEVERFRADWTGMADDVDVTPYHTWIGAVKDERCYGGKPRFPCALLWYTGVVNADGRISPCCIDYQCNGVVGRVGEGGFGAIWNGKAMKCLRMMHLTGNYDETQICGPCDYWLIKENIGRWLRRKYRITE